MLTKKLNPGNMPLNNNDIVSENVDLNTLTELVMINIHAFGVMVEPNDLFCYTNHFITADDMVFAEQHNLGIQPLAHASVNIQGKLIAYAAPQFVKIIDKPTVLQKTELTLNHAFNEQAALNKIQQAHIPKPVKASRFIKYDPAQVVSVYIRFNHVINLPFSFITEKDIYLFANDIAIKGNIRLSDLVHYKDWLVAQKVSVIFFNH
ncbi:MAG: hypothetical protein V4643_03495 [Bacteroidota bacterium]